MYYVATLSGGLDSTTLVYSLVRSSHAHKVDVISFDYGQRHKRELEFARRTAQKLDLRHDIVDLTSITSLLADSGSSLVSDQPVPKGHYAADNMKQTVVPNRNMIMMSIAIGAAVARGANHVATAVHAGDHFIYPDCRPRFFAALNKAAVIGNEGFGEVPAITGWDPVPGFLSTPLIHLTKTEIAQIAVGLKVPFEDTWSCYEGGEIHCGTCGTCVERLEALEGAEAEDKTRYADSETWRSYMVNK